MLFGACNPILCPIWGFRIKFIFHAFWDAGDPRQFQLFNLTSDPYELQDLARSPLPAHVATLAKYKKMMAQQFLEEGRDKYGFVTADGELLGSKNRTIRALSPNYPSPPGPSPGPGPGPAPGNADCSAATAALLGVGTGVVQVAGHPPTACEGFTYTPGHSLAVLAVGGHGLCMVPSAAAGGLLSLAICTFHLAALFPLLGWGALFCGLSTCNHFWGPPPPPLHNSLFVVLAICASCSCMRCAGGLCVGLGGGLLFRP